MNFDHIKLDNDHLPRVELTQAQELELDALYPHRCRWCQGVGEVTITIKSDYTWMEAYRKGEPDQGEEGELWCPVCVENDLNPLNINEEFDFDGSEYTAPELIKGLAPEYTAWSDQPPQKVEK